MAEYSELNQEGKTEETNPDASTNENIKLSSLYPVSNG